MKLNNIFKNFIIITGLASNTINAIEEVKEKCYILTYDLYNCKKSEHNQAIQGVHIEKYECTKKYIELNNKGEGYIGEYKVQINKGNVRIYVPNSDVKEYFYNIRNRNGDCSINGK